ncbi:hypothetical protein FOMCTCXJ_CDS_0006 [Pseudomonas phage Athelas]|nr:hypothetical protein FOMCTCXJ_CDS_0003 [Pseudomonas phage Athelas]WVH05430.1 hypothetical protein FOMCTCXJ_CDS_0006 [Pseudomonas phage Athelas]
MPFRVSLGLPDRRHLHEPLGYHRMSFKNLTEKSE